MVQSDIGQEPSLLRRRSGRGRWITFPLLGLAILSVGWSALWFYAAHRAGSELDAVIAREALKGRVWTCPDRAFGGFPLEITMTCRNPSFAGKAGAKRLTAQAAGLRAKVALYDPNRVIADVAGPLHVVSGDATEVRATWAGLTVNLIGPMQFSRGSIDLSRLAVTVSQPGADDVSVASAGASLRISALDRRSPKDSDQEVRLRVADLAAPLLDEAFGSSQPVNIDATAVVSDVDAATGTTLAERLDNWRAGGGRLKIAAASLVKGGTRLDAAGLLGLDDEHRAHGDLSVGLSGAEGLLQQAHLPMRTTSVGGMLGLLGGGPELPDHDGKQPDMKLSLTLANGRVSLGPFRLPARLLPIY